MPYKNKELQLRCQRRHNKARRLEVKELLAKIKDVPCLDCGNRFPAICMDFDHRNPDEKSFAVSGRATMAISSLLEEIAKCDIICACCHRIRTEKSGYPWLRKRRKAL